MWINFGCLGGFAQTAVFAPGDLIDITLADNYDVQMKFNLLLAARRGRAAIKKEVRDKLVDLLEVEGMDKEELEEWVTEVFHCIDNCDFDEN